MPLNWSRLIMLVVTVMVSIIGYSSTGASTTLFILAVVGIPARDLSLLFALEWILDRCNSTVNVLGDCVGVLIVEHLSKRELEEMDGGQREGTQPEP
ncbi:excitatory amino acid transporter 3-like [Larimichthys crocea]|uniref:excitatory amino acid transporter 3-like n=1 Tax=Larimichthys crocea TaxID=215358 RepID=UPI000F5E5375|nr:excitatory amino acid transporter 3-like [Larimichthys crocea]